MLDLLSHLIFIIDLDRTIDLSVALPSYMAPHLILRRINATDRSRSNSLTHSVFYSDYDALRHYTIFIALPIIVRLGIPNNSQISDNAANILIHQNRMKCSGAGKRCDGMSSSLPYDHIYWALEST